ncbi:MULTISPECIES: HTH-like domain-containing protein [Gammaproteobacteria]|jgi:hypothetical protein|nr:MULTISPECIES: hypothetical protein [Gammaproteobacteria]EKG91524.1 hypothetical protein VCHE16_0221 [Vibrio paracholerae HE-16]MCO7019890.1 hypothetical protein [Vibrio paracholerae]MCO7030189.1 hypothetical protein [Vibrio paracholerae]MCO7067934.1 hypothetical protein [Vibrio paracholerae]MDM7484331.1 hypothetical protein [Vibrio metschnikovii]
MKEHKFLAIRQALVRAPRNHCMAEAHLQMIKYADDLKNITAKEFCEEV